MGTTGGGGAGGGVGVQTEDALRSACAAACFALACSRILVADKFSMVSVIGGQRDNCCDIGAWGPISSARSILGRIPGVGA